MAAYAQTNLELYSQLGVLGWDDDGLARVRAGYALAMELFTGAFRPSGKTFLAHLVGTASVLAAADARRPLVIAGLLHAAYSHGEFGDGIAGVTSAKRARVRTAVGDEAEDLVARYAQLPWGLERLERLVADDAAWARMDADLLLMRVCNELEENLDLGVLHGGKVGSRELRRYRVAYVAAARRLRRPRMADEFERALDAASAADPASCGPLERPGRGVLLQGGRSSYLLPPASHRLRAPVAAMRIVRRAVRRVRELFARD